MNRLPRYARPVTQTVALPIAPRLESWMAKGHPDQIALGTFLDATEDAAAARLAAIEGPMAMHLTVALSEGTDLLATRDLDNYVYPLAKRLRKNGHQVASVWATKRIGGESTFTVASATSDPLCSLWQAEVSVTASSQSNLYKEQVRDGVADIAKLADGPAMVELAFVVGPRRNWLNFMETHDRQPRRNPRVRHAHATVAPPRRPYHRSWFARPNRS